VPVIDAIRGAGFTSLRAIADQLNARGIRTFRERAHWHAGSVRSLFAPQAKLAAEL
jgi:hypothetical protein